MTDRPDKDTIDDVTWQEAVLREAVIRRLVCDGNPNRTDFHRACQELGIKRSRLYELIGAYRVRPLTSSLVTRPRGIKQGSRRLPEETEAVITEALKDFCQSSQKPSITRLHKEIQRLCRLRHLRAPSWHTLRKRVDALDPAELTRAREGAKVARDRYRPVPGHYNAEYAYEVVQIDHTPVDIIVVDRKLRQPLQRPWLTLAMDVASRMVAGFYLSLEPPSVWRFSIWSNRSKLGFRVWALMRVGLRRVFPIPSMWTMPESFGPVRFGAEQRSMGLNLSIDRLRHHTMGDISSG